MRKSLFLLLSLMIIASLALSACSPKATEAPVVDEMVVVEEPAEEPVEEPVVEEPVEEPAEAATPDLDSAFGSVLSNMTAYNTVKADALLSEMAEDTPPFLLDVRTTGEVEENGHIEGAINIPLNEVGQNLDLLPSFDTSVVVYCGSGWRATIAMTALNSLGWKDVSALKVTFADWKEAGNPVVEGPALEAMALKAASPDPALSEVVDSVLSTYGVQPFGGISADDLILALVENPDLQVIDVRTVAEVEDKGNIDAPNLTFVPLEEFVTKKDMWPSTDSSIVVYCGSGHRSTMAMTILWDYGFTDVSSLKGGYGGWAGAGYPVVGGTAMDSMAAPAFEANFANMLATMESYNTVKADGLMTELIEDVPPFLLDVRTTAELEENGYIEGAAHIPLGELAQNINLLPDFNTPIVTYCGSGWRATIAMTTLYGLGWTDVRALKTPFTDWVDAGNPVVGGLPEPMVLDVASVDEGLLGAANDALTIYGNPPYSGISTDDLTLALVDVPELTVLDVRRGEELTDNGVIDVGEVQFGHLPLESFLDDIAMWPEDPDSQITVFCGSGHRSTMAATILGFYGYSNVTSLKGGFGGWVVAEYPIAEYVSQ